MKKARRGSSPSAASFCRISTSPTYVRRAAEKRPYVVLLYVVQVML